MSFCRCLPRGSFSTKSFSPVNGSLPVQYITEDQDEGSGVKICTCSGFICMRSETKRLAARISFSSQPGCAAIM